ncbi:MAG: PilT/PilU family type 4a pilus ATPase [Pseudomonadota bacterium]
MSDALSQLPEFSFVERIYDTAVKLKASDIHIRSDLKPSLRVDGKLYPMDDEQVFTSQNMDNLMEVMLRPDQKADLAKNHQIDTALDFQNKGTLRVHIFRQRGKLAMANRIIGHQIPSITELGLPPMVQKLAHLQRGLVLISGATSNGKSTTLAAVLEEINQHFPKHVLTVEDPIEFIFTNKRALFSQRDIGIDAVSFSMSIVAAMREDPDVILISDLRDNETIENALIAAETGHLVFATTHAPTAPDTITRIIATFPSEKQDTIRVKMAQNLRAVVAQRLIPAIDGIGRVLACEYMIISARIRELMLDPVKVGDIARLMQGDNVTKGVLSFDVHLSQLVREKKIDMETALEFATSRTDMKLRLSGLL